MDLGPHLKSTTGRPMVNRPPKLSSANLLIGMRLRMKRLNFNVTRWPLSQLQPRLDGDFRGAIMFRTAIARYARVQLGTATSSSSRPALPTPYLSSFGHSPPGPPKPKTYPLLRWPVAASQPIRSNPTPTRSETQPVFTRSTSQRYGLPQTP